MVQSFIHPLGASRAVLGVFAPKTAVIMERGITPTISYIQAIILQPVAVDRYFGDLTLLSTGTSTQKYIVYINGVDRTRWIRVGANSGPGIVMNMSLSAAGTCTFTTNGWPHGTNPATIPVGSQYIPASLESVQIRRVSDGLLMFNGSVDTLSVIRILGHAQAVQTVITCADIGIALDRRIVGLAFTGAPFDFVAHQIATAIVQKFLQGTGISFVFTSQMNAILGPQIYTYITAREALNSLAQQTGTSVILDMAGNLRFADPTDGYMAAPQNITNTTDEVMALTIATTRVRFANRWYAKSNQNLGNAVLVDTYTVTVAGWGLFPLTQAGPQGGQVPTVTVNGAAQRVIPPPSFGSLPQDTSWDWEYFYGGIARNQRVAPLQPGDVVDIIYPSPLPYVAVAEDLASIAAVGLVEDTVEAGDITDKATLQDIADAALLRGKEIPITVTIKTRTDGYQPGQRFNLNRTDPPVSDNFLVTSVSSREINQDYFEHMVTASNKAAQLASDPAKFASDIIKNLRMTTYNIIERITFNLAVTVEGITNPGLSIGVKPAIKTAQKNGTAGWVTLIFNSLSQLGSVTTTDIVIDLLQNGTSIYGTQKLTLPAGFAGEVKFSLFATDPLKVSTGDVFTMNVLSADPLAMDGIMELVTVG